MTTPVSGWYSIACPACPPSLGGPPAMTTHRRRLASCLPVLGVALLLPTARAAEPSPEGVEFFEKKVRPILVNHCFECHSAGMKRRGGLLADSRAGLLRGGDTGPALVPGKPDD